MAPRGWGRIAVRRSDVIVALGAPLAMTAGAAASRPWPFVYGRHAHPGELYGLFQATCRGQHVITSHLAGGTADQDGNLTIVAPNIAIRPQAGAWVEVYRGRMARC